MKNLLLAALLLVSADLLAQHKLVGYSRHLPTNGEGGFIWEMNIDGSGFKVLHDFDQDVVPGYRPSHLIKSADGNYYGTAIKQLYPDRQLEVFKFDPLDQSFHVLQVLPILEINVFGIDHFFEGSDGWLYGSLDNGIIYKIDRDGNGFQVLTDDDHLRSPIKEGLDGMIYWFSNEKVVRMDKNGQNWAVVSTPYALSDDEYFSIGNLWPITPFLFMGIGEYDIDNGSSFSSFSKIFYINTNGPTQIIHNWNPSDDIKKMVFGSDGYLYGRVDRTSASDLSSTYLTFAGCSVPTVGLYPQFMNPEKTMYAIRPYSSTTVPAAIASYQPMTSCQIIRDLDSDFEAFGEISFETGVFSVSTQEPHTMQSFSIAPNPSSSDANVLLTLPDAGTIKITVLDGLGRTVYSKNCSAHAGENQFEIPAKALNAKGMYQVTVQSEKGVSSQMLSVN